MSSTTQQLMEKGLALGAPAFLKTNVHYETIMGSHAYGVADTSVKNKVPDYDVYGFAIPPKEHIFPHLSGYIAGFGPEPTKFEQFQKHHMFDKDALGGVGKEWDLQIFNIVKFFELCRENNPNMLDSLFTPENCILHCTQIGRMVRDNRKLFLSKQVWKKFRGYAHSQLNKMNTKETVEIAVGVRRFEQDHFIPHTIRLCEVEAALADPKSSIKELSHLTQKQLGDYLEIYKKSADKSSGRFEMVKIHGYDVKFAYHIIRLFDEAEQIMLEGDMNLQRAREPMKAIRRGDWTAEEVRNWTMEKEKALEVAYTNCKLPEHAPYEPLRQLLLQCLEEHYGSLSNCIATIGWAESALKDIDALLDKNRKQLYGNESV
jgi:predicted nucleotidyltransferase